MPASRIIICLSTVTTQPYPNSCSGSSTHEVATASNSHLPAANLSLNPIGYLKASLTGLLKLDLLWRRNTTVLYPVSLSSTFLSTPWQLSKLRAWTHTVSLVSMMIILWPNKDLLPVKATSAVLCLPTTAKTFHSCKLFWTPKDSKQCSQAMIMATTGASDGTPSSRA